VQKSLNEESIYLSPEMLSSMADFFKISFHFSLPPSAMPHGQHHGRTRQRASRPQPNPSAPASAAPEIATSALQQQPPQHPKQQQQQSRNIIVPASNDDAARCTYDEFFDTHSGGYMFNPAEYWRLNPADQL
jgi:hypothetical protein